MATEVEKATRAFTAALSAAEARRAPIGKWQAELVLLEQKLPDQREQRLTALSEERDGDAARLEKDVGWAEHRAGDLRAMIARQEAAHTAARLAAWDGPCRRLAEVADAAAQGEVRRLMNDLQPLYTRLNQLHGELAAAKLAASITASFDVESLNVKNRAAFVGGTYWPGWASADPASAPTAAQPVTA